MTDTDRQRLAAILGMLGSSHAGERAAAALQAEAFRRKHGLTWAELIAMPASAAVIPDAPAAASEPPAWTPPPPPPPPRPPPFVFVPWTPIPLTPWKPKKTGWFRYVGLFVVIRDATVAHRRGIGRAAAIVLGSLPLIAIAVFIRAALGY